MPQLIGTDIADLVKGTLYELGRMRFQQIAQDLQDYVVFNQMFRDDRVQWDSGIGIQRTLMTTYTNAARHVGLYSTDNVDVPTLLAQLQIPWVHAETSWAFEYREVLMNRGEALVTNIIEPRRANAMISLAEDIEAKAWSSPALTDTHLPYGIKYWIVTSTTTGFNGGAPSGHTTVGGINPSTVSNFKNYTAQYTNVSKADALRKMKIACRQTHFTSPVDVNDYRTGSDRYKVYCNNDDIIADIEELGEAQNENLGHDLFSTYGRMMFKGFPIVPVPALDSSTNDPIYGIDHSTFHPVVLKGDYLREEPPSPAPGQHNVFWVFVDLSYNYVCIDRRRNWALTKS